MNFDAVMVLGKELRRDPDRGRAELRARAAAAAVAWTAGVPRIMALEGRLRGQSEAGSAMVAAELRRHGVPDSAMVIDEFTRSTREEALGAQERCVENRWSRLLVITAGYHVPRAVRCFEEVLGPGVVTFMAPEQLLEKAGEVATASILGGEATEETLRKEARTEALLSLLETLVSPLPKRWRWGLEVRAGGWLRGVS